MIAAFIGYQQFSGTNIIDDIQYIYCKEKTLDSTKCKCFVTPIITDLETRFSEKELGKLKSKKLRANTEFIKSYKAKEDEIKKCFEKFGDSKGILDEILSDIKKTKLNILK